jgi:hypothetical protein
MGLLRCGVANTRLDPGLRDRDPAQKFARIRRKGGRAWNFLRIFCAAPAQCRLVAIVGR